MKWRQKMNEYEVVEVLETIVQNKYGFTNKELDALVFCIKKFKNSTEYKLLNLRNEYDKILKEYFGAEVKND